MLLEFEESILGHGRCLELHYRNPAFHWRWTADRAIKTRQVAATKPINAEPAAG